VKDSAREKRLVRALKGVEDAWDALQPGDLTDERIGELQRVWVALTAAVTRLRKK
jgi:hypothetical protein